MRPEHDTGGGSARKRARRIGRRRALAAATIALIVQSLAFDWGLPGPCDASPDAPWPLRSMLAFEEWPLGEVPPDKYPEGWNLLAGGVETVAARLFLDRGEREAIARLRDELVALQGERSGAPGVDVARELVVRSAGLEPALSTLVRAGRVAALAMALLLALAAAEVAGAWSGPRFGWIAAACVGLAPATVHYAAVLNTDVPALSWCAIAWALCVAAAPARAIRGFVAGGAAMGLSAATKDPLAGMAAGIAALALLRRRAGETGRLARAAALAAGGAASYALASGITFGSTFSGHLEFIFGVGSQPYRQFPATPAGIAGLLGATGDRFLAAGGVAGLGGVLLALVVAGMRRKPRLLWPLLPAASYVALFLVPAGYVYPRFALPLVLCGAIGMAVGVANVPGMARRRKQLWLGVPVLLWAIGEASAIVEAKRDDARPESVAALARMRAPGDEVWVCAQPWLFAPFPPIDGPRELLDLPEIGRRVKRGDARPRFLWLAVDPHSELALDEALDATAKRLGFRRAGTWATTSNAPLVRQKDGLLLPTVALFERIDSG